jgi:hypothetical protein
MNGDEQGFMALENQPWAVDQSECSVRAFMQ